MLPVTLNPSGVNPNIFKKKIKKIKKILKILKKIYFIILTLLTLSSFAQNVIEYKGEQINQLDENGNQTGVWKLYDEEKNIIINHTIKAHMFQKVL